MSELSAYLHIPFCRRKCRYCDFYSAPPSAGDLSAFTEALCRQIRSSPQSGASLSTVYFGGGTPSLLSEDQMREIFTSLKDTFDLSFCREITAECNPESLTDSLAQAWYALGINRVSMGVQSLNDRMLSILGRLHTAEQAVRAVRILRQTGFRNLSLDLMIALPGETEDELLRDLEQAVSLEPEHLSVYLLKIEPQSCFGKSGVNEASEEVQRRQYLTAHRLLTQAGYEHYEISNFARPKFRSQHNSMYWAGGEYLAFGPGAAGFYGGVRFRIPEDTAAFLRGKGRVSPVVEEVVDSVHAKEERLFLGLRCSDGVDASLLPPEKLPLLNRLTSEGYAVWKNGRFALTAEGFLVSDAVISELLP